MVSLGKDRREARLNASYLNVAILNSRTYNAVLGGVVLYGIIVNIIMCIVFKDAVAYMNPILFYVGYSVSCLTGIFMAAKSKNPVVSFIGYNLVVVPVGLVVSLSVTVYGGLSSGIVLQAFIYTAIITGCMIALSVVNPNFFSKLGGILLASLFGIIITEFIALLLGIDQIITSWLAAVVFSLYIGYDIYRSQQFEKTMDNAVDCALDIYLDVINLFLNILRILSKSRD